MLEKIFNFLKSIFNISYKLERLEKDLEKLQIENKGFIEVINRQQSKIDVLTYAIQREGDNTKLWVEKELANFERRLPQGKRDDEKKD